MTESENRSAGARFIAPERAALIIGVGNAFRRDDGVGIAVARALRAAALPGLEVCEQSGEGTALIGLWRDRPLVYVIDAVSSGARVGTIHRFDATAEELGPVTRIFRGTSHQIGLGEAVELGRVLGQLPARLIIYGIESTAFGDGVGLSPAVAGAVGEVVDRITAESGFGS